MAAIVKFLRPSGEPIYVNADHVVIVKEAPAGRATLHLAEGHGLLEVDATPDAVAEILTSAAPGFVVTNSYGISTEDQAELGQQLEKAGAEAGEHP